MQQEGAEAQSAPARAPQAIHRPGPHGSAGSRQLAAVRKQAVVEGLANNVDVRYDLATKMQRQQVQGLELVYAATGGQRANVDPTAAVTAAAAPAVAANRAAQAGPTGAATHSSHKRKAPASARR